MSNAPDAINSKTKGDFSGTEGEIPLWDNVGSTFFGGLEFLSNVASGLIVAVEKVVVESVAGTVIFLTSPIEKTLDVASNVKGHFKEVKSALKDIQFNSERAAVGFAEDLNRTVGAKKGSWLARGFEKLSNFLVAFVSTSTITETAEAATKSIGEGTAIFVKGVIESKSASVEAWSQVGKAYLKALLLVLGDYLLKLAAVDLMIALALTSSVYLVGSASVYYIAAAIEAAAGYALKYLLVNMLAEGGIVTSAQLALLAEAGQPEVVVPFHRLDEVLGLDLCLTSIEIELPNFQGNIPNDREFAALIHREISGAFALA